MTALTAIVAAQAAAAVPLPLDEQDAVGCWVPAEGASSGRYWLFVAQPAIAMQAKQTRQARRRMTMASSELGYMLRHWVGFFCRNPPTQTPRRESMLAPCPWMPDRLSATPGGCVGDREQQGPSPDPS